MPRQGGMKLGVVERAVTRIKQPGAEEHGEARQRGQGNDLERGLQGDRAFQEEAGKPIAGQRGDLEPDEQVEQVGGERRADQCGDHQLEQAGITAQFARAEAAQFRQRVQQQHRADDGGGQGEDQAEWVGGERDPQRLAVHRGPQPQVVRADQSAEHAGRLQQQDDGGAAEATMPTITASRRCSRASSGAATAPAIGSTTGSGSSEASACELMAGHPRIARTLSASRVR